MKIDTHNGWFKGLGDVVCFAWIGAGLQTVGRDVEFYAHGWRAELLRFFQQRVTDDASGAIAPEVGYAAAVRERSPLNYVDWIAAQCGLDGLPSAICHPCRPRLDLPPMPRELGRAASARVLLFPECAWPVRTWPRNYWLELARLLKDASIDLAIVTEKRFEEFGSFRCIYDQSLAFIAGAMQRAQLVIGNDSGPAHLAGTIGTRTLVIHGPTAERIFAHLPEVISHRQRTLPCSGCEYLPPFRESCGHGCHELYRTYPKDVFAHAMRLLGEKPTAANRKSKTK
jgi:hypothetical protein